MCPATAPRDVPWIGDSFIDGLPAGATCLSVGEGWGDIALRAALRRPDIQIVAVDLSDSRMAHAREVQRRLGVGNVWFAVADVMSLPFVDDAFDAGYARGVLHIVPDPTAAVAELTRVLRQRLLVDQLANRPFFALWFWLLQRYEVGRAWAQGRPPDRAIWQGTADTIARSGRSYRSLRGYRRWFSSARQTRVCANSVFIWETPRHQPILGWAGCAGAIDVWL
jgi:ubiquinone/menaquinone biosynthesis C-methylase UbiE